MSGFSRRLPKGDAKTERGRLRSREWHIQFQLPWEVWVRNTRVARFRHESDARGFARARFGDKAEILNWQQDDDLPVDGQAH